ncbi:MAG: hypothetical protein KC615_23440, partial [Anaerolineae bacterium]|nr:hypothetical protein [Anaerolineae bacterium]
YETVRKEKLAMPDIIPLIILLTDGAGNVSISERISPQDEAHQIAHLIKEADIRTVTVNMEHVAFDQGLAQNLADKLGGPCYSLSQIRADNLLETVRQEMDRA